MYDICRANVDALPDFQNIDRFVNSFTDKTPAPQVQDPGKQVFNCGEDLDTISWCFTLPMIFPGKSGQGLGQFNPK